MECRFQPGDRVVCVNPSGPIPDQPGSHGHWLPDEALVEGRIYTVTSAHVWEGSIVLHLAEVQRSPKSRAKWGDHCGYNHRRFRPAQDIEQFRSLVAGVFSGVPIRMEKPA